MNKLSLALGGFLAIGLIAVAMLMLVMGEQNVRATGYGANVLTTATTSNAVSVSGVSARVLATTTNALGNGTSYTRVFASICNPSATVVYLNMNADKAADTTHSIAQIGAAAGYNSCYEITDRNLYQGSVTASSTAGAVSVFVTDYVQQ